MAEKGAKARSTKQKARIQRVEELKEQDAPETGSSLDFAIGSHRLGKQVIEAEGVDISRGGNQLVRSFNELIVPGTGSASSDRTGSAKQHS